MPVCVRNGRKWGQCDDDLIHIYGASRHMGRPDQKSGFRTQITIMIAITTATLTSTKSSHIKVKIRESIIFENGIHVNKICFWVRFKSEQTSMYLFLESLSNTDEKCLLNCLFHLFCQI